MSPIAMKMMKATTAAFAVKYLATFADMGGTDGINSMHFGRVDSASCCRH